ncbi:MAG: hypothetical protein IPM16_21040 [Chloroflexi bacterium]|nr:hypothetical protein [Chloroflexota bacterium]
MVDRRLIDALDSAQPERRKAAIQQLARTKDIEALRYLEAVERADNDGSVRDLARKAIVYIKRNNPGEAESPAAEVKRGAQPGYASGSILAEYANRPAEPEPVEAEQEDAPPQPRPRSLHEVTESRQRAARGAMEMAGRASFDGLNARAAKYLVEAFKLNPNLQYDAYAVGLAATISGLYKDDAVKAVQDGSILELFDKKEFKAKAKREIENEARDDAPPAGWGTALIDLLLYGLINAVIVGVSFAAFIALVTNIINSDPQLQAQMAQASAQATGIINQLIAAGVVLTLLYALIYGLIAIVLLLLQSFFIHVAARMILGGDGTLANLIHKTALFLGIMTALVFVAQIGGFLLPLVTEPAIGIGIYAVSFFLSLWTLMGYSSRIGRTYDFGAGRGCAAIFLANIFFIILGLVCFAAFGQAYLSELSNQLSILALTPMVVP